MSKMNPSGPGLGRLLLAVFGTMLLVTATADEPEADGAWELSDLSLKLRARNTTSAYSTPVTKEMETLLLHTVDPDQPGVAFRCEKGKLFVILAVTPADLRKALREGVRRPRDAEVTYQIDAGEEVTEPWVSMSNGRLFMAHEFTSTSAIYHAARNGQTLVASVKGEDPVTIELPESDDELFDYYIESCKLDPEYNPNAGS